MRPALLKAAFVGLVAGFVGGLFGLGGGVIIVPGLVLWLGLDQHRASGTSLAAIIAISAAALVGFAVAGEVDWTATVVIFIGSSIGAVLGARYMGRIPEHWLSAIFAVVLLVAAVRMAL